MPLRYKIDVIAELKNRGYNTNKIRKERILSEGTLQKLRTGEGIGWDNIQKICELLECQPNDFIEYVKD